MFFEFKSKKTFGKYNKPLLEVRDFENEAIKFQINILIN